MTEYIRGYRKSELFELDPDLLRAVLRENAHFTVEYPLYQIIFQKKKIPNKLGHSLQQLLQLWEQRGLPRDYDDVEWCYSLLDCIDQIRAGRESKITNEGIAPDFSEDEQKIVRRLIFGRRSIRIWKDKPVPRELIEEILHAGLWAPNSCNLQTIRFIIMEGKSGRDLFGPRKIALRAWPNRIIVAQDLRPYEYVAGDLPEFNRDLDCGAAVQNMLLRAFSLGLGAVWTSLFRDEAAKIHRYYQLPDHIRVRTGLTLGWPAQAALAPGRMDVSEAVLAWR